MSSENKTIACLELPQQDQYGNRSTFLYPLNALGAYEGLASEGLVPKPTIDDLSVNNFFQGALGLHKMNARIAAIDGISTPSTVGKLDEFEGVTDYLKTLGQKLVKGFQKSSKDELAKVMRSTAVEMNPKLQKLVATTEAVAQEAGSEGVNGLVGEIQNYLNGRNVNYGNIHPSFVKLAGTLAKNKTVHNLLKKQRLAELEEISAGKTSLGELGFMENMPSWVYWLGGAAGIGIIGWFLLKQFGKGGGGLKFNGLSGLGEVADEYLGGSEKRVRKILGGKNNFSASTDPISSVIQTHELNEYTRGNYGLLEGLGRVEGAIHLNGLGEAIEPDDLDETPLTTLELGAFAVMNRIPKYQNFKRGILNNPHFMGEQFETQEMENGIAGTLAGFGEQMLGDSLSSAQKATIGELGGFFSRLVKKVKKAGRFVGKMAKSYAKNMIPGAGLVISGIKSLTGRRLKKQSKAALRRAKLMDAQQRRMKKLALARKAFANKYRNYRTRAQRTKNAAQRSAYQRGATFMKKKVNDASDKLTNAQNVLAKEKLRSKQDITGFKQTLNRAKRDYSKVKRLEKTRVQSARAIRRKAPSTPNLIYLTPREYADHIQQMQKAKAIAEKMKERVSMLLAKKRSCSKKLAKNSLKIYQLKNKLANISKKYQEGVVSGKIDEEVARKRNIMLQKLSTLQKGFSNELFRIKNYSDESIKAAGKQINEQGINMMFDFFEKLSGAMRDVKDISQVSEFLKFFPELMKTFRYTVDTVMPEPPNVENVINVPEPSVSIDSKPQALYISPSFKLMQPPAEVENKVSLETEVHHQDINVPVNVNPQNVKIIPVPIQIERPGAKPAGKAAWFKPKEPVAV